MPNLQVIEPTRTFLEKLLILHCTYCGFRNEKSVPVDKDRISRHYYDVAMITGTEIGRRALADETLLSSVREHHLVAFRQAWKRFEEAVPGSLRIVPEDRLRKAIEQDYAAMQGMMLGDAPDFDWLIEQLTTAKRND